MAKVRLQDVAEHAGVSMKTVSNVVRNAPHVSEPMRLRVQKAIEELDYRPNMMGRQLATGRCGLIALAFADVAIPYFAELAHTVSRAALAHGFRVILEETNGTLEGERALVSSTELGIVDGMIFQPSVMTTTELAMQRAHLPIVLLGEAGAPLTMDRVMIDNVAASREVTSRVIESGRTRIGFVGHEISGLSETSRQRIAGYQQALEHAGLPVDSGRLVATEQISANGATAAVGAALDGGLDVDALVCRDDLAAIGTMRALQERGVRIPQEVAVTGWDNIGLSSAMSPSLTTIAPDRDALAERALAMLFDRINGFDGAGRHESVPYSLIVRESAP